MSLLGERDILKILLTLGEHFSQKHTFWPLFAKMTEISQKSQISGISHFFDNLAKIDVGIWCGNGTILTSGVANGLGGLP